MSADDRIGICLIKDITKALKSPRKIIEMEAQLFRTKKSQFPCGKLLYTLAWLPGKKINPKKKRRRTSSFGLVFTYQI